MAKNNKLELKIVFDTNALHTKVAHHLLNEKTRKLIEKNSHHKDIQISWYLPEVVKLERQFQMLKFANDNLPSVQKIELLLNHNLNINSDILKHRVEVCINSQIQEQNIIVQELETDKVNWKDLILNSVNRIPPFEQSDKEKGFRDALILETFSQIVHKSPCDRRKCRIILITNDTLLSVAVNKRFQNINYTQIKTNIEECEELISMLVNEVSEEYIKQIHDKISLYFLDNENKTGVYYEYDIGNEIKKNFKKELKELCEGAVIRENGKLYISAPSFSHKIGQKFYWSTKITIEGECFKNESVENGNRQSYMQDDFSHNRLIQSYSGSGTGTSSLLDMINKTQTTDYLSLSESLRLPISEYRKIKIANCKAVFEIDWSVVIKTDQKFGTNSVENVRYLETIWY